MIRPLRARWSPPPLRARTRRYAGSLWAVVTVIVCAVIVWALIPFGGAVSDMRYLVTNDAYHETVRLNSLVEELLAMTRLEAGRVALQLDWESVKS